ncbi:hypothetical protein KFL_015320010, partial [Klebsormidium nitens]
GASLGGTLFGRTAGFPRVQSALPRRGGPVMTASRPLSKLVRIVDPESGIEKKVKFRNQASLSDYLRNKGIGSLREIDSEEAPYSDDFDDILDGQTYLSDSQKLESTIQLVRRERTNVIKGEEDEFAEALVKLFSQRGVSLRNRPELRTLAQREVDAVLVGNNCVVIGFCCTKLDEEELRDAFDKVSGILNQAVLGDPDLSFLLVDKVFVTQMASYIPHEKLSKLEESARKKTIMLVKRNGNNYSFRSPSPVQTFKRPAARIM